jgi:2,3-bisphosphoglycerate-independent phosphoglycerate mutase
MNGMVFITADHGNAEEMINPQTGQISKEHSSNPVPFVLVAKDWRKASSGVAIGQDLTTIGSSGILADVAPTILDIMNLSSPPDMTGKSLKSLLLPLNK